MTTSEVGVIDPGELLERLPAVVYTIPVDFDSPPTYLSPGVVTIVGYTPEEFYADPSLWASLIHPDDRPWVLDYWRKAICGARTRFAAEYRVRRRDGDIIWLRDEAIVADGGSVAYGVMAPVSGGKLIEERRSTLFVDKVIERLNKELPSLLSSATQEAAGPVEVARLRDRILFAEDALTRLKACREAGELLHDRVNDTVKLARSQGRSWQDIGRALGITRQAALARFKRVTG